MENYIRALKELQDYIETCIEYNQTSSEILQEIDKRIKESK